MALKLLQEQIRSQWQSIKNRENLEIELVGWIGPNYVDSFARDRIKFVGNGEQLAIFLNSFFASFDDWDFRLKTKSGKEIIKDCYFKDFGDHQGYISGLAIPTDSDGVCRNFCFINCDFHAGCTIPYANCEFIDCNGTPNYKQA